MCVAIVYYGSVHSNNKQGLCTGPPPVGKSGWIVARRKGATSIGVWRERENTLSTRQLGTDQSKRRGEQSLYRGDLCHSIRNPKVTDLFPTPA